MAQALFLLLVWVGIYVGLFAALGKVLWPWAHRQNPSRGGAFIALGFGTAAFALSYLTLAWILPPPVLSTIPPEMPGAPGVLDDQARVPFWVPGAFTFLSSTVQGILVAVVAHWVISGLKERK